MLSHLKYDLLGENNTLPIILSALLFSAQVEAIVVVLQRKKQAMGWQISDIYGITPSLYMHKTFIEEGYKLVVQPQ